jgi:hypothetical protein
MATDDADLPRDGALAATLRELLGPLPGEGADRVPDPVDDRWLAIGLRLGLERPVEARDLLTRLEAGGVDTASTEAEPPVGSGEAGRERVDDLGAVPAASMLLARSAAMPLEERLEAGRAVVFGWTTRLTPSDILGIGRVVQRQLAAGDPPNVGRGFGLAWDSGIRIPRSDRDAMLREFTQLQVVVGSVLVGQDLSHEPVPRREGLDGLFGQLLSRRDPGSSRAAAAIDSSGEIGRRGLVSLWNTWIAMRYRALMAQSTFDLLIQAWVEVVGPLPEP